MSRRVLFLGEAITTAHVVRPHVLARALVSHGYDVVVACDRRAWPVVGHEVPYERVHLDSLSPQSFRAALSAGRPPYDTATAQHSLEADLSLIGAIKPDLLVSDFRLTAHTAAELTHTPHAAISNAWWHAIPESEYPVPELEAMPAMKRAVATSQWARHFFTKAVAQPFNRLRRHFGLQPIESMAALYHAGDAVLLDNARELAPSGNWPNRFHWLGPIHWTPPGRQPAWWNALPKGPLAYVTLGSSGGVHHLKDIVAGLQELNLNVMVATSGRVAVSSLPAGVFAAPTLDGLAACRRADLVVCHGGAGPLHQALASGRPVLAVPSNLDQCLSARSLEMTHSGRVIPPHALSARRVAADCETILNSSSIQASAWAMQQALAKYDAPSSFVAWVSTVLAGRSNSVALLGRQRPSAQRNQSSQLRSAKQGDP